ncbi:hypothetical protein SCOR_27370 [Sulfidibacter corallicola]
MELMSLGHLPEKYGLHQSYRVLYLFEEVGLAKTVMHRFVEMVPKVWRDYFLFGMASEVLSDPVGSWYTGDGRKVGLLDDHIS